MYTSLFYESTLGNGDDVVHVGSKPSGKNLCNELGHRMDMADWSEVRNLLRSILLGNERNIYRV